MVTDCKCLHSRWSGIKDGSGSVHSIVQGMSATTRRNITITDCLIIDEISMISANTLEQAGWLMFLFLLIYTEFYPMTNGEIDLQMTFSWAMRDLRFKCDAPCCHNHNQRKMLLWAKWCGRFPPQNFSKEVMVTFMGSNSVPILRWKKDLFVLIVIERVVLL